MGRVFGTWGQETDPRGPIVEASGPSRRELDSTWARYPSVLQRRVENEAKTKFWSVPFATGNPTETHPPSPVTRALPVGFKGATLPNRNDLRERTPHAGR
jgi:hypothetical protein